MASQGARRCEQAGLPAVRLDMAGLPCSKVPSRGPAAVGAKGAGDHLRLFRQKSEKVLERPLVEDDAALQTEREKPHLEAGRYFAVVYPAFDRRHSQSAFACYGFNAADRIEKLGDAANSDGCFSVHGPMSPP